MIFSIDTAVNVSISEYVTAVFASCAHWISTIADAEVLIVLGVVLVGYFIWRRQRRDATIMALSIISSAVVIFSLKELVARTRPFNALEIIIGDPSFPSGHAGMSAAFFGALLAILLPKMQSRISRILLTVLAVSLIFIIGMSRLVLSVHWASDVVVGWVIGIVAVVVSVWVGRRVK